MTGTDRLAQILDAHAGQAGALLPILHDVQEEFGHIPETARITSYNVCYTKLLRLRRRARPRASCGTAPPGRAGGEASPYAW